MANKNTSFSIEGIDKLEEKLKKNVSMQEVKDVVKVNIAEMQKTMVRKASFRGHMEWKAKKGLVFVKPTGTTKRSIPIGTKFSNGGFTGSVQPMTEYAYYLEKGTRFMEAQPFVRPAFYPQTFKFKKDLNRLMK